MKTYDPKSVIVTFGGIPLEGFADGTFINIVPNDAFTKAVGADGTVSRSKSVDSSLEITITLQQTSESNDYLSAIALADKLRNAGALPLIIKDLEGTSTTFSEVAWVRKPPDSAYAKEIENREWVFDTGSADYFVGGNQVVS